jgi:hypothetical protein
MVTVSLAQSHHWARSSSTRFVVTQRLIAMPIEMTIASSVAERNADGASATCATPTVVAATATIA